MNNLLSSMKLKQDKLELREYQLEAARDILEKGSSLVIMPTAMGKTFVAVLVIAKLIASSNKKVLFMAPTKPLVEQQANRMRESLDVNEEEVVVITGEVPPEERSELWKTCTIACATPQTVRHDLLTRKLLLEDFQLVVFDEVHRASGDYAYVFIAEQARKKSVMMLGLTASPSSEKERIDELVALLGVKHVVIKQESDSDVREFVQNVGVKWEFVELPEELREIRKMLDELLKESMHSLREMGFWQGDLSRINKRDLLLLRSKVLANLKFRSEMRSFYTALSNVAGAMNLLHAIDLLESQGVGALKEFFASMRDRKEKSKAVLNLLKDFRVAKIVDKCDSLISEGIEHPKIKRLKEIVGSEAGRGKSIIVFAHYRDSITKLEKELNSLDKVTALQFVGRGNGGMTQKEQTQTLQDFREKKFNVLVASSVAEEGIDVPAVDLVIFYDAVPSEIRLIQRRGRAGRTKAGETYFLITKDSRDEAYFWISRRKEKQMKETVGRLKKKLEGEAYGKKEEGQKSMKEFF